MEWFHSLDGLYTVYVYISNGNNSVISLYRNLGFRYSHDVFGGFITAYSLILK